MIAAALTREKISFRVDLVGETFPLSCYIMKYFWLKQLYHEIDLLSRTSIHLKYGFL